MVNMKFRQLKKNNVRNANKKQLIQDNQTKCSNCPSCAFMQACSVGIENKKRFVEIKPVPVAKYVEI